MFAISNLKSFAGKTVTEGMRVARIIAKSGKVEQRESESMGVMVPAMNMGTALTIINTDNGKKWLADKLESVQDSLIRAKYASSTGYTVYAEDIDSSAILAEIDKIVSAMDASRARLITAKSIAEWFQADMSIRLQNTLKAKGLPMQTIIITTAAYLAKFQVLAAREDNRFLDQSVITQLKKCLALLDDGYESELVDELIVRMDNIPVEKPLDIMDAL